MYFTTRVLFLNIFNKPSSKFACDSKVWEIPLKNSEIQDGGSKRASQMVSFNEATLDRAI